jgi:hypothetical protein
MLACFDACLVALTEAYDFTVVVLDGKMLCITSAVTIRQPLEVSRQMNPVHNPRP